MWSCSKCHGILIGVGELVEELLAVAPDLLPAGGARSITTLGRRTVAPLLTCASCGAPMEPVFVGGIDADRCYHDEQIWFDTSEHELVLERAKEQAAARRPVEAWFARLLAKIS